MPGRDPGSDPPGAVFGGGERLDREACGASPVDSPRPSPLRSPRRVACGRDPMTAVNCAFPIVTLLTDFGTRDHYVASMKGVLLTINPALRIVDITHKIAPQEILEAGFTLACAYRLFPAGSIHLLVVDPGVGTSRRLLAARTEHHFFVGPDNGALGIVFAEESPREVVSITASHHFRKEIRSTFHGRDILAPVAAQLSLGT